MIKFEKNIDGFRVFLNTGAIKGIRKAFTDKLYLNYPNNLKEIFINEEWNKIKLALKFSDNSMNTIIESWKSVKSTFSLYILLYEKGLSTFSVRKIFNIYKDSAESFLKKNPYIIMENVGVGFKIADKVALDLGIKIESFLRIEAGIFFILDETKSEGHTYISKIELINKTKELLNITNDIILLNIDLLIKKKKLISIKSDNDSMNETISDIITFQYEKEISIFFKKKIENKNNINNDEINKYKKKYKNLSAEQFDAVIGAIQNNISIITGSAGTGKTTVMKAIKEITEADGNKSLFIAPTGRAARRIKESIGYDASTIHKALGYKNISLIMKGIIPKINKLKYEYIIIDETSMVDLYLMRSIIEFIDIDSKLILVGDPNQLPSILCGNILYDLIASSIIPCFKLTHIFRQEINNEIIEVSSKIANGIIPRITEDNKDICFITKINKEDGFNQLCEIANEYYDPVHNRLLIYFITAMNRGCNGANLLNLKIQNICKEKRGYKKDFIKIIGKFYPLDRVIQIKNNYTLDVFNGEIGVIIEGEYNWCKVKFEDKIIEYDAISAQKLSLAYAITTHKSQGSEFPYVCIPLFMEHYIMNSRQNLYTAITRASKKCIIVGEKKALFCAIKKDNSQKRNTLLQLFLTE